MTNGKHDKLLWKVKEAIRLFFSDEVWDEITAEEEEKDRHLFPGHTAGKQKNQEQET